MPPTEAEHAAQMDVWNSCQRFPLTDSGGLFRSQYRGCWTSWPRHEASSAGRNGRTDADARRVIGLLCGIPGCDPSGHLFLWVDKFHLCQGVGQWLEETSLGIVDLVTWDKATFGMGYRTRRRGEHCIVLQREPRKAKGVWTAHNIPDVVREKITQKSHTHAKPVDLQGELLAAVSNEGDFVIDPAAGSFSVLTAAVNRGRTFLGCDLNG